MLTTGFSTHTPPPLPTQRWPTWNEFHNATEVEYEGFLEAEEQQEGCYRDQHQESRNSDKKRGGSKWIIQNGIEGSERSTAHVDSLGVVGVAVLEDSYMAESGAGRSISNPLWLNECHKVQNTPNYG